MAPSGSTLHRMQNDHMATMQDDLKNEIAGLRVELERLNGQRFIRVQNSLRLMLWHQFLRGLATGLGTVVGATILVSVFAYFLSQIDFIPIVGEWAAQIAERIGEAGGQGASAAQ